MAALRAVTGKCTSLDDPGYYEKFYFTPGDLGFTPISTSVGKLGVLVCWDQWYPEAARLMAMAGAEMLIYPTAIGWDPRDDDAEQQRQLGAWVTIQRAHSCRQWTACNRRQSYRVRILPRPTGLWRPVLGQQFCRRQPGGDCFSSLRRPG